MAVTHWPGLFSENFQSQGVQRKRIDAQPCPLLRADTSGAPQGASSRAEPGCCCSQPRANPQLGPSLFSRLFGKRAGDGERGSGTEHSASEQRRQTPNPSFPLPCVSPKGRAKAAVGLWREGGKCRAHLPWSCHHGYPSWRSRAQRSEAICDSQCKDCHPHPRQNNPTAHRTALLLCDEKIERDGEAMLKIDRPAMILSYILS